MTINNHHNNLHASDMHDLWLINYCALKLVTVKLIIICDSNYMEHVPSTRNEHKFVTILFLIFIGLKLMLFICLLIPVT
jgi:hypothetical protein